VRAWDEQRPLMFVGLAPSLDRSVIEHNPKL